MPYDVHVYELPRPTSAPVCINWLSCSSMHSSIRIYIVVPKSPCSVVYRNWAARPGEADAIVSDVRSRRALQGNCVRHTCFAQYSCVPRMPIQAEGFEKRVVNIGRMSACQDEMIHVPVSDKVPPPRSLSSRPHSDDYDSVPRNPDGA